MQSAELPTRFSAAPKHRDLPPNTALLAHPARITFQCNSFHCLLLPRVAPHSAIDGAVQHASATAPGVLYRSSSPVRSAECCFAGRPFPGAQFSSHGSLITGTRCIRRLLLLALCRTPLTSPVSKVSTLSSRPADRRPATQPTHLRPPFLLGAGADSHGSSGQ